MVAPAPCTPEARPAAQAAPAADLCSMVHAGKVWYRIQCRRYGRAVLDAAPAYNRHSGEDAMRNKALTAIAVGLAIAAAFAADIAKADEIKVLCTIGVKPALPEVVAEFERATGHKVSIAWGNAAALKIRYLEGEPADVAVLTAAAIDDLATVGKVTGGRVDLARSGVGLGVKAGAPKPDISSPEALKRTLLAAKSVGYSTQGASGVHFVRVIERLGIAAEVKAKHKETTGVVGELIASGEAE